MESAVSVRYRLSYTMYLLNYEQKEAGGPRLSACESSAKIKVVAGSEKCIGPLSKLTGVVG